MIRKKLITLCIAGIATFATIASFAENRIFILAGQSNMHGRGKPSEITDEEKIIPENVSILINGKEWDINKSKNFGIEVSFAREMSLLYPNDNLFFVKFGVGGTSLYYDWTQLKTQEKFDNASKYQIKKGQKIKKKFNPNKTNSLYHKTVDLVKKCIKENQTAKIMGYFGCRENKIVVLKKEQIIMQFYLMN